MYMNIPWQAGCAENGCEFSWVMTKESVVQHSVTAGKETPVPAELGRSGIYYSSTGQIVLVQPVDQFVREAVSHIHHLAVLPIDANDDQLVDRLMARKHVDTVAKPLTRRV